MPDSILHKILERIDEKEKGFVLNKGDIRGCPAEELRYLMKRGILTQEVYSSSGVAGSEYLDDGTMKEIVEMSPPEPFYTVIVPRILEAIREDNALDEPSQDLIKGRLFDLGKKRFRDLPPIRVYLSLRNRDLDWFDDILKRIRRRPDNPALLLVPRSVLISNDDEKENKSCGLVVCCIADCLTSQSWKLPWDELETQILEIQEKYRASQEDKQKILRSQIAVGKPSSLAQPLLILDKIVGGKTEKNYKAKVIGRERFHGLDKKIGSRSLFFIYLLFKSNDERLVNEENITVVEEEDAIRELLDWGKNGYLRISGKDKDKPAYRVIKMWHEFVKQMNKEKHLKDLFVVVSDSKRAKQKCYAIKLRPNQTQILVTNILGLFHKD